MAKDFICQTINPNDPTGPLIDVVLPGSIIERYYKYYPVRYENLRAVKHVLDNPERIFFGIRAFNEGGWCYTGRPKSWFIREAVEVPFPKGKVFTVYLNPQMRIYEGRAEIAAPDDKASPFDWQDRYGGLLWKSTS